MDKTAEERKQIENVRSYLNKHLNTKDRNQKIINIANFFNYIVNDKLLDIGSQFRNNQRFIDTLNAKIEDFDFQIKDETKKVPSEILNYYNSSMNKLKEII